MEVKGSAGRLFKNDRKADEKHADYKGSWTDEQGREFYLDGYINVTKNGDKYIKLKLGKQKQAYQPPAKPKPQPSNLDLDDGSEVPF